MIDTISEYEETNLVPVSPVYSSPEKTTLILYGTFKFRDIRLLCFYLMEHPEVTRLQFVKTHSFSSDPLLSDGSSPVNEAFIVLSKITTLTELSIIDSKESSVHEELTWYAENFNRLRLEEQSRSVNALIEACEIYRNHLMTKPSAKKKLEALNALSQHLISDNPSAEQAQQCFENFKAAFNNDESLAVISDVSDFHSKKIRRKTLNVVSLGLFGEERKKKIPGEKYWKSHRQLFVEKVHKIIGDMPFERRVTEAVHSQSALSLHRSC